MKASWWCEEKTSTWLIDLYTLQRFKVQHGSPKNSWFPKGISYLNGCHFRVPGLNLGRVCGGLPTNRNYESLIGIPVNPQKYYDLFLLLVWLVFQKILDILKLSMSREDQTIKSKTFLCHMPSLLK